MDQALVNYEISLPDRQLACAPLSSRKGKDYFAAMCAAANFAWSTRQVLTHRVRETFSRVLGGGTRSRLSVVYDVGHNIAKLEQFGSRTLCVHRKGATRAFGPSSAQGNSVAGPCGDPALTGGVNPLDELGQWEHATQPKRISIKTDGGDKKEQAKA